MHAWRYAKSLFTGSDPCRQHGALRRMHRPFCLFPLARRLRDEGVRVQGWPAGPARLGFTLIDDPHQIRNTQ